MICYAFILKKHDEEIQKAQKAASYTESVMHITNAMGWEVQLEQAKDLPVSDMTGGLENVG